MKRSRIAIGGALAAAIAIVGTWEGLRTVAYRDIVGVPTVCYGETRGVKMGDRYTREECQAMLGEGIKEFAREIDKCLVNPKAIPDKTYAAFVSLAYNIGSPTFCKSTVVRRANAGNLKGACQALTWYNRAGGRKVQGLVNRRADEYKLCIAGLK